MRISRMMRIAAGLLLAMLFLHWSIGESAAYADSEAAAVGDSSVSYVIGVDDKSPSNAKEANAQFLLRAALAYSGFTRGCSSLLFNDEFVSGNYLFNKAANPSPNICNSSPDSVSAIPFRRVHKTGNSSSDISKIFLRFTPENTSVIMGASSIRCGTIDKRIPQRYCESSNIAIRLEKLPEVGDRPKGLDLPPSKGVLAASCSFDDKRIWRNKTFGGGAAGWFYDGIEFVDDTNVQCDACKAPLIRLETPVFFISRWDTTNPYQFHQDALNTFLVYALLDLSPNEIQPVLLDRRETDGPFTIAWSHIFTSSNRLIDIREISSAVYKHIDSRKDSPPILCLRSAVWGIHGGISPLSRNARTEDSCTSSPLFEAFRAFMISRIRTAVFGNSSYPSWKPLPIVPSIKLEINYRLDTLLEIGTVTEQEFLNMRNRVITVTYAVRASNSSQPPTTSRVQQIRGFFEYQQDKIAITPQSLKKKHLARVIPNDDFIVDRLASVVSGWSISKPTEIIAQFRAVDFASLTFEDQVALAQDTDLFVGPHGAVFAHLLYLRRSITRAGVVEMKPPERSSGNEQFRNLSKRLKHMYSNVLYSGPAFYELDMKNLEKAVLKMLNRIGKSRKKQISQSNHKHRLAIDTAVQYIRDIYADESCWKTVTTERGIKVTIKEPESSTTEGATLLPAFRGDGIIKNICVQEVSSVLRGFGGRRLWDPRFDQGTLLETLAYNENLVLSSQKGNLIVRSRDFLTANCYRLENAGDEAAIVSTSVEDGKAPPDNSYFSTFIRGEAKAVAWLLRQVNKDVAVTYIVEIDVKGQIPHFQAPLCILNVSNAIQSNGTLPFLLGGLTKYGPSRRLVHSNEWVDDATNTFKIQISIPSGKSDFSIAFPRRGKYGFAGANIDVTHVDGLEMTVHKVSVDSFTPEDGSELLSTDHTSCVLQFKFVAQTNSGGLPYVVTVTARPRVEKRSSIAERISLTIQPNIPNAPVYEVNGEVVSADVNSPVDSAIGIEDGDDMKKSLKEDRINGNALGNYGIVFDVIDSVWEAAVEFSASFITAGVNYLKTFEDRKNSQLSVTTQLPFKKSRFQQLDDDRLLNYVLEKVLDESDAYPQAPY
ncbi:hypothetical protein HK100_004033 [Physocladia obscura]|uniref:START domain-containing protein n=1 Tax=Physocladia obscura TaxID=109957 RepID=A0AAD5T7D7_9FUNG|nr:hypothetical protein HK100_004033 [Physocladia obscura]